MLLVLGLMAFLANGDNYAAASLISNNEKTAKSLQRIGELMGGRAGENTNIWKRMPLRLIFIQLPCRKDFMKIWSSGLNSLISFSGSNEK